MNENEKTENLKSAALRYFGFFGYKAEPTKGFIDIYAETEAHREYKRNSKNIDFLSTQYKVETGKIKQIIKEINSFIDNDIFIKIHKGSLDTKEFKKWKKGADCKKRIENKIFSNRGETR
jgi:hypothetical protein